MAKNRSAQKNATWPSSHGYGAIVETGFRLLCVRTENYYIQEAPKHLGKKRSATGKKRDLVLITTALHVENEKSTLRVAAELAGMTPH